MKIGGIGARTDGIVGRIDGIGARTDEIAGKIGGIGARIDETVVKIDGTAVKIATMRATAIGIRRGTTDATIAAMARDGWAETTASTGAGTTATTANATTARRA
jgi:hypothetical protein